MKKKPVCIFFVSVLAFISYTTHAQMYRAAVTEALGNNGKEWVEKKLPPSVITFSDYSGQIEIKTIVGSLAAQQGDSAAAADYADFTMNLDRDRLPEQIAAAKTFTTTGTLTINNLSKKITAQYILEPRNSGEGFGISVIIRFSAADFNLQMKGEPANESLIVRVSSGYLNKQQNNF
ncbi:MAG TPA: hypothetical protein VK645_00680 [Chitinophagaceae bacterium]|nr:hypothetical protein [Chitinophagaceae bacterium]